MPNQIQIGEAAHRVGAVLCAVANGSLGSFEVPRIVTSPFVSGVTVVDDCRGVAVLVNYNHSIHFFAGFGGAGVIITVSPFFGMAGDMLTSPLLPSRITGGSAGDASFMVKESYAAEPVWLVVAAKVTVSLYSPAAVRGYVLLLPLPPVDL